MVYCSRLRLVLLAHAILCLLLKAQHILGLLPLLFAACDFTAALSENLKQDSPLGVEILGSKVVLFREGNEIKCLDDTCPHR